MMKHLIHHAAGSNFLLILLILLGVGSNMAVGAASEDSSSSSSSSSWSLELENAVGDEATLNKVWCASATGAGDLTFGPVQGADTSAPDASIWAVTQSPDQFLLHLRLPSSLDYSCRLQTPPSLWSFSLPLSTLNQDGYASGDIKCHGPWHWPGSHPEDIPPDCQLFDADGYAIASVVISSLTVDTSTATVPEPSPSAPAPASASPVNPAPSSTSISPTPVSADIGDDSSSKQPFATPTSMGPTPTPTTAPAPPRKLLN